MQISVTRDSDGESGIHSLEIGRINFMECESDKRRIKIYTDEGIAYTMGTIKYWETSINNTPGYQFAKVDRNVLVNLQNVRALDNDMKMAYFGPSNNRVACGIAYHKYDYYQKKIFQCSPYMRI